MDQNKNYIELVKRARLGDDKSLEQLAQNVRGRLYAYVYRMVLDADAAQDIVQESMLEMFKILGKLEKDDRFWPWLRGIAFNKMRRHAAKERRHRRIPIKEAIRAKSAPEAAGESLADAVGEELKQIVVTAMGELKPNQRRVLTMRCYEQMEYSEIADLIGSNEFNTRLIFYRAKKALTRALSRRGLGKGFVVTSLLLFGKLTAPGKAAAADLTISAATLKAGAPAAIIAAATSKTTVLSFAAAGLLAVTTVAVTNIPDNSPTASQPHPAPLAYFFAPTQRAAIEEYWYYFPQTPTGPVMMQLMIATSTNKPPKPLWRQDEEANYFFDSRKNIIYIENFRSWRPDLAVRLLPTDNTNLWEFIAQTQGLSVELQSVRTQGENLLVVARRNGIDGGEFSRIIRQSHVLEEEYFGHYWPMGMRIVDNRDAMHTRGWTYFTIQGHLGSKTVSGEGRLPFFYAATIEHSPWLRIRIGHQSEIVDTAAKSLIYDNKRQVIASYKANSFFKGLGQQWLGLHSIDSVRRAAAEQYAPFETKYNPENTKSLVTVTKDQDKLIYTIDMIKDLVEKIEIFKNDQITGELTFNYIQDIENITENFKEPQITRSYTNKQKKNPGLLWPIKLKTEN